MEVSNGYQESSTEEKHENRKGQKDHKVGQEDHEEEVVSRSS
jgi:hypothetical protein